MRRSYRLALILAVLLACAATAPSRGPSFARSLSELAPAVVGSPAFEPPLGRAADGDASPRGPLLAASPGLPRAPSVRLSSASAGGRAAVSGPSSSSLATDADAVGLHWVGVFAAADEALVSVAGIDFAGPRSLVLWKLDPLRGHATPVTRLQSEVGRPFLAEHLLLSARGARLVLAPSGSDPFGPRSSTILEVPARDGNRRESL